MNVPHTLDLVDADGINMLSLRRVHPTRILRAIADHTLPSEIRNGRPLVRRSDAEQWIASLFGYPVAAGSPAVPK